LGYRRAGAEDLRAVREAIKLGALGPVTARRNEPGMATRLEAAVRGGRSPTPEEAPPVTFHDGLVLLSGSPVLTLFVQTLSEFRCRQAPARALQPLEGDAGAKREPVHHQVIATILAGDESLAQHRMRRDLAVCHAW
jgi:DNA-binding FadR family transcriptional regulator